MCSVEYGHGNITGQTCDDCTACSGVNNSSTLGKPKSLQLILYSLLQEGMIERHVNALKELANNNKQGFVSLYLLCVNV